MDDERLAPPLGLYVHIPWCVRKCPYCDFNSHHATDTLPERRYVAALLADLESELAVCGPRPVQTVFIGGGTPSLFGAEAIADLLEGIGRRIPLAQDAEITLEANPGTAEAGKFAGFRAAGVNRLSIGIQSFQDRQLAALGRIHDRQEALAAVEMAKTAGFVNFNLDLMFGLPGQGIEEAAADVRTAIALEPAQISYYQLTLEPGTPFAKHPPALPEDGLLWNIQQTGQAMLSEAGYRQYEVSAYARAGFPCRHNLNYWEFGDYLGIGAGAHGKLTQADGTIQRRWKQRHPAVYLEKAGSAQGVAGVETVAAAQKPLEFLMNALRLREGFAEGLFSERTGQPLAVLQPELDRCCADGLLLYEHGRIRCSEHGWQFLDSVLGRFL
ncbi:radical SAM family heme chaperone HemW [Methylogaea oryzae]|uniref:radical SAM family heme chaperone HemW n=1 Tax=Methylogaea oryzae TaxID=1295382 RepID=UPI001FE7EA6F|nr:radical SAM family heme chaperone HemW [Methylogaea oryzae]